MFALTVLNVLSIYQRRLAKLERNYCLGRSKAILLVTPLLIRYTEYTSHRNIRFLRHDKSIGPTSQ